jgi:hypothetical protein
MAQSLDLTTSSHTSMATPAPILTSRAASGDLSMTVVLVMCAVGIALSLVSLALPGWALQPYDVANFPHP